MKIKLESRGNAFLPNLPAFSAGWWVETADKKVHLCCSAIENMNESITFLTSVDYLYTNSSTDSIKAVACWPAIFVPNDDLVDALKLLVDDIDILIDNSDGVQGLHRNGDIAHWADISSGGEFECWLGIAMDKARAALNAHKEKEASND